MTDIREGDIGRTIAISTTDFDLSGQTELRMVFKKPSGTIVTKLTADGVSAPAVPLTIDVDGVEQTFLANKYWEYKTEAGLLDEVGTTWSVHGEYVDGTPKDLSGDVNIFEVLPRE